MWHSMIPSWPWSWVNLLDLELIFLILFCQQSVLEVPLSSCWHRFWWFCVQCTLMLLVLDWNVLLINITWLCFVQMNVVLYTGQIKHIRINMLCLYSCYHCCICWRVPQRERERESIPCWSEFFVGGAVNVLGVKFCMMVIFLAYFVLLAIAGLTDDGG